MIIGVDLGATKTLVGLLTKNGKIIDQIIRPTPKKIELKKEGFSYRNFNELKFRPHQSRARCGTAIGTDPIRPSTKLCFGAARREIAPSEARPIWFIVEIIDRLLNKNRIAKNELIGIGVGAAGQVNQETGDVILTNLQGWGKINLIKILEKFFSCPIFLENDANLAALGEFWKGQGRGTKNMVFLTIGTGIGGGIIIDGKLYRGQGFAGEIGHMIIDLNGPKCNCGGRGCFETLASGSAIKKKTGLTSEIIFRRARKGDEYAKKIVLEFIKNLSFGIINLIHIFHPEKIILGGGIMNNADLILPPLRVLVKENLINAFRQPDKKVKIEKATLSNQVALIGAVYLITSKDVKNS